MMKESEDADLKIGLALGSGAARGWSHIGIIKGLAELGIKPEIVCGSSIGALVGAAYAADKLDLMESWSRSLTWKEIIRFLDPSLIGGGFIQGEKLTEFVNEHIEEVEFHQLKRELGIVATELESGREVWFRSGPVMEAVRASISLPGLFTPLRHNGRWLVDGGLANPVPVSLCRAMGADLVIAVNLNGDILGKHFKRSSEKNEERKLEPDLSKEGDLISRVTAQVKNSLGVGKRDLIARLFGVERETPGLYDVLASSINIMQDRITRSRMAGDPPDVILTPRMSKLGLMEFDKADLGIAEGLREVERMRPSLEQVFKL
ncbi:MAG: patatin-like phospholipase RssA [Candidatus Thiodiazotropha sp. 6PLUC2]